MNKKIKKVQNIKNIKKEKAENDKVKKIKIRIIGIGGGGGAIVSEIASQISGASFLAANTDTQALKTINKNVNCFQFGQNLTQGLGTGMKIDLGSQAAQNEKDKIKKLCQGYDICIIIACLGGGTGGGATPIFAKISKELGNITYGIFTLPFKFEGERKMEMAKDSFRKIKNHLDAITIIPNERIFQIIDKDTPLKQAFSLINKKLANGLKGLIETIYEPGLINIDFADLKTIFQNQEKLTYLDTIEIFKQENSTEDLTKQILNSPLYPYTIKGAKGVLFNIVGQKNLSLSEVEQISKNISELVSPEAKIIFGISHNKKNTSAEPIIKTTLLTVGCTWPLKQKKTIVKNKTINKQKRSKKAVIKTSIKLPIKKIIDKIDIEENRTRKDGLQIKKEVQELEMEMLEKEKFWEIPAFLRRKSIKKI